MKLNLGDNIRTLRRANNLTQEQLADRLGVSYQSVSRWENGNTYPDMELLPALAKIFSVSIDQLMGCSEDEKVEQALELIEELRKASYENRPDAEKVNALIRTFRRNYLDSHVISDFWYRVNEYCYRLPDVLPEVRLTAEEILSTSTDPWERNETVYNMSKIENDEYIDKFLDRYASALDLTRDTLLRERYQRRKEWDKAEPLRQTYLFGLLDQLIGGLTCGISPAWENPGEPTNVEKSLRMTDLMLSLLHHVCAVTPDPAHPISSNGKVDHWLEPRLWIGMRRAYWLVLSSDFENAFIVLEDTVSLLEKAMAITEPTELPMDSPWLDQMIWIAEEDWQPTFGIEQEERCLYIHWHNTCYLTFPSWYCRMLSWEQFDRIRSDPRFEGYEKRLRALIATCPAGNH